MENEQDPVLHDEGKKAVVLESSELQATLLSSVSEKVRSHLSFVAASSSVRTGAFRGLAYNI